MSTFEDLWKEQLAVFEQQLKEDRSYQECLQLQLAILENSEKPEEKEASKSKKARLDEKEDLVTPPDPNVNTNTTENNDGKISTIQKVEVMKAKSQTVVEKKKDIVKYPGRNKKENIQKNRTRLGSDCEKGEITCSFCSDPSSNTLVKVSTPKVHTEMNHIRLRFYCSRCGWSTKERYGVRYHIVTKHDIPVHQARQETVFECGVCSYRGMEEQYKKHILSVHPEFRFTVVNKIERGTESSDTCQFCGFQRKDIKSSVAKNIIRSHIAGFHMRCRYKCRLCGHTSSQKQEVYRHVVREHTDPLSPPTDIAEFKYFKRSNTSTVCSVCEAEEDSFHKMLQHMKLSHQEYLMQEKGTRSRGKNRRQRQSGGLKCVDCDYRCELLTNLKSHIMRLHVDSQFTCILCKISSSERRKVVTHITKDHAKLGDEMVKGWRLQFIKNFCNSCGFEGTSQEYDEHLTVVHKMLRPRKRKSRGQSRPLEKGYTCTECKMTFRLGNSLKRHIELVHMSLRYFCKLCNKIAPSNMAISHHVEKSHGGDLERDVTAHCGKCDKDIGADLSHKHLMAEHSEFYSRPKRGLRTAGERSSQPNTRFSESSYFKDYFNQGTCELCQSCVKPGERDTHVQDHLQVSFVCVQCEESDQQYSKHGIFKHLQQQHPDLQSMGSRRLMESKVQLRCGICKYQDSPEVFKEHPNYHKSEILQEEKKYQRCHLCDFKHLLKKKLIGHLARDHDVKPFPCTKCPYESKTLNGIINHRKTEHPDFRYRCEQCKFSTLNMTALHRHVKHQHGTVQWLPCTFCDMKFKRKENVLSHSRRIHGSPGEYG